MSCCVFFLSGFDQQWMFQSQFWESGILQWQGVRGKKKPRSLQFKSSFSLQSVWVSGTCASGVSTSWSGTRPSSRIFHKEIVKFFWQWTKADVTGPPVMSVSVPRGDVIVPVMMIWVFCLFFQGSDVKRGSSPAYSVRVCRTGDIHKAQ